MLPIVEIPKIVEDHENLLDASKRLKKHFKEYVTGLIVSENFTVAGINSLFLDADDQSSLNRFLTEYEWDEEKLNDKRLELLQSRNETKWIKSGFIVIDDTLTDKDGKHIAGVGKLFDHSEGKYVLAQNIVTSHYTDYAKNYPINFMQYFKEDSSEAKEFGFKTKIKLACELIDDAEKRSIPAKVYLFDAWFLCQDVKEKIESKGKSWVSRCKSDRLIVLEKKISLAEFSKTLNKKEFEKLIINDKKYLVYAKSVRINKLGRVKLVVSYQWDEENKKYLDEPAFIVTNRFEWSIEKILSCYLMRFTIDSFYRDAKQYLGFEDSQMRSLKGNKRHWYLGFVAYSLIKLSICTSNIGRKINAQNRATVGEACRMTSNEVLFSLINWIYKKFSNNVGVSEIIRVLTM